MNSSSTIRLGTRASALARWQALWVRSRLEELGAAVELVPLSTRGDRQQSEGISSFGGEGVFTKELERALLAGEIDLAVHSLKDLPTAMVQGVCLAAVPARGPVGDVLVSRTHQSLEQLSRQAAVGTGSLRRRAQLWHVRPDLRMLDIRGNVDTRLKKLDQGEYDALVLAEAGLERLGLAGFISQVLPRTIVLPAVGQGALGLQTRSDDEQVLEVLAALDDPATHAAVRAERALLAAVRGGCLAPIGALGTVEGNRLHLTAAVLSSDGRTRLSAEMAGDVADPDGLGRQVADNLLAQGAAALIAASRQA